jgi:hypothetical protein
VAVVALQIGKPRAKKERIISRSEMVGFICFSVVFTTLLLQNAQTIRAYTNKKGAATLTGQRDTQQIDLPFGSIEPLSPNSVQILCKHCSETVGAHGNLFHEPIP